MTDQEINAAIAEALGVQPVHNGYYLKHPTEDTVTLSCDTTEQAELWKKRFPKYADWLIVEDLRYPDYVNDLNAMAHATATLTAVLAQCEFARQLDILVPTGKVKFDCLCFEEVLRELRLTVYRHASATARQRAEAFLRTLGKWRS